MDADGWPGADPSVAHGEHHRGIAYIIHVPGRGAQIPASVSRRSSESGGFNIHPDSPQLAAPAILAPQEAGQHHQMREIHGPARHGTKPVLPDRAYKHRRGPD